MAYAIPTLVGEGAILAGTVAGGISPTLPTHQADDILICEALIWAPNTTGTMGTWNTPSGWNNVSNYNNHVAGLLNDTIHGLWWKRATSSSETNPVCDGPAYDTGTDMVIAARAYVVRGAQTVGTPYSYNGGGSVLATANGYFPGVSMASAPEYGLYSWLELVLVGIPDNTSAGAAPTNYTAGTAATSTTGTDAGFQSFTRTGSSNYSFVTSNVAAPVQGKYWIQSLVFFGPSYPGVLSATDDRDTAVIAGTVDSASAVGVIGATDASDTIVASGTFTEPFAAVLDGTTTTSASTIATVEHVVTFNGTSTTSASITATVEHVATLAGTSTSSGTAIFDIPTGTLVSFVAQSTSKTFGEAGQPPVTTVTSPFVWFDFDAAFTVGTHQLAHYQDTALDSSTPYIDLLPSGSFSTFGLRPIRYGTVEAVYYGASWAGSPGEVVAVGALTSLPASGAGGLGLFGVDDAEYPGVVTINKAGVHYYAVVDAYAGHPYGAIRCTTTVADTLPHVWSLRINGADSQLYLDGVMCPWDSDGANGEDGNPYDWVTGMAPGINQYAAGGSGSGSTYIFDEGGYDSYFPFYNPMDFNSPVGFMWLSQFGLTPLLTNVQRQDLSTILLSWLAVPSVVVTVPATADGSSTSSGTVSASIEHPATFAGVSTSSGAASIVPVVLLTLNGSSTTSGTVTAVVSRAATFAGSSTTSGTVTAAPDLQISLAGSSTSSGSALFVSAINIPAVLTGSSSTAASAGFGIDRSVTAVGISVTSGASSFSVAHVVTALGLSSSFGALTKHSFPLMRFNGTAWTNTFFKSFNGVTWEHETRVLARDVPGKEWVRIQ